MARLLAVFLVVISGPYVVTAEGRPRAVVVLCCVCDVFVLCCVCDVVLCCVCAVVILCCVCDVVVTMKEELSSSLFYNTRRCLFFSFCFLARSVVFLSL